MIRVIVTSFGRVLAVVAILLSAFFLVIGVENASAEATCASPSMTQYNGTGPTFHASKYGVSVGFSNPYPSQSSYFWYSGNVSYYNQYGTEVWDSQVNSYTNSTVVAWGAQAPSGISWSTFLANGQEAPSDSSGNRYQGETVIGNATGGC